MAFRDGKHNAEAYAGAMFVSETMLYVHVLAKLWGAK